MSAPRNSVGQPARSLGNYPAARLGYSIRTPTLSEPAVFSVLRADSKLDSRALDWEQTLDFLCWRSFPPPRARQNTSCGWRGDGESVRPASKPRQSIQQPGGLGASYLCQGHGTSTTTRQILSSTVPCHKKDGLLGAPCRGRLVLLAGPEPTDVPTRKQGCPGRGDSAGREPTLR
jgi:hypothetical protein